MWKSFLLLALFTASVNGKAEFPDKLLCNRLTGNYVTCCGLVNLALGRPLEPGDKMIINGSVLGTPGNYFLRFNTYDTSQTLISLHMRTRISTDTFGASYILFNTLMNGQYGRNEFAPNPFTWNSPVDITIEYTGSSYLIYSGGRLIKSYALRHNSQIHHIAFLELNGTFQTNWVQMDCARPLTTTPAPTTPRAFTRRGNGHGHGHGHGNGHGGHHHGGGGGRFDSSSRSSSSEEFCE